MLAEIGAAAEQLGEHQGGHLSAELFLGAGQEGVELLGRSTAVRLSINKGGGWITLTPPDAQSDPPNLNAPKAEPQAFSAADPTLTAQQIASGVCRAVLGHD